VVGVARRFKISVRRLPGWVPEINAELPSRVQRLLVDREIEDVGFMYAKLAFELRLKCWLAAPRRRGCLNRFEQAVAERHDVEPGRAARSAAAGGRCRRAL